MSQINSNDDASSRNCHAPGAYGLVEAEREARHRLSLIKGPERWLFRWDPGDEAGLINRIAEMARDPEIPFDWYDAAVVCKHVAQPFAQP
jgi:hypothetical protein